MIEGKLVRFEEAGKEGEAWNCYYCGKEGVTQPATLLLVNGLTNGICDKHAAQVNREQS